MLDAGHEVAFFALRRGQSEEYSALTPHVLGHSRLFEFVVKLRRNPASTAFPLRYAFPPLRLFLREWRRFRPTVAVIRDPNTAYGVIALAVAKLHRVQVVLYTQGPKYRVMGPGRRLLRQLLAAALGVQWMTPVLGEQGTSTISRMHYVPFVVEPMVCPEEKRWFGRGHINVMTVGKFEPRKNHSLLLQAVRALRQRGYPVRLTIVGECTTPSHRQEYERVRACVESLDLEDSVDILVNQRFSAVRALYGEHDAFVLPSRSELVGVSLLEAMAAGLPVVCSDSAGAQYYVERGMNGYVFRANDVDDLTEKLSAMLEDRRRLVDMGRRSHQLVLERHRPESYARALERIVGGR